MKSKPLTPLHIAAADADDDGNEALALLARLGLSLKGYDDELDETDRAWLVAAIEAAAEQDNPAAFLAVINGNRPAHRPRQQLTAKYARPVRMYHMLREMGHKRIEAKRIAETSFSLTRDQLNARIKRCAEESPETEESGRSLAHRLAENKQGKK